MKGFKMPRKPKTDFAEKLVAENQELGAVLAENLQGALPAIALDGLKCYTPPETVWLPCHPGRWDTGARKPWRPSGGIQKLYVSLPFRIYVSGQTDRSVWVPAYQKRFPSPGISEGFFQDLCYGWLSGLSHSGKGEGRPDDRRLLVDALFAYLKRKKEQIVVKGKLEAAFTYLLNQEKYLRVFLNDGDVPMDNNASERAIRGFCIGKKNWEVIDTINGAKTSAVIYSIAETSKANNLKPYEYFEHLLTVILEHMEDTDRSFLEELLPWSPALPENIRK